MRKSLMVLFGAAFAFVTYKVIDTSLKSNLFEEWDYLAGIPWMRATLVDFYANVLVLSVWVCYKESLLWKKIVWILAFMSLGSIATCAYVFWQLWNANDEDSLAAIFARKN